jgi:hypothetical protein
MQIGLTLALEIDVGDKGARQPVLAADIRW